MSFLPLFLSFILNLIIIPLIRRFGIKVGRVALPREDRWHQKPTPTLGGVGIFLSTSLGLLITQSVSQSGDPLRWGFFSGSLLLFLAGLYDEFRPISPIAKFLMQIFAATIVIGLGYTSTFFTPRIENAMVAQFLNVMLTYIWLVGITNAINLLDNMDGLAGGISLISAGILAYFFWQDGNWFLLAVSLALVGSLVGFLFHNFPPAKIFMGDSGSLFLGFSLASLAIAQQQQASNVFAVIGVPTLIFLLPILDTSLVMFTRLLRGQSPVRGGRDHTSHRLVAFGLSERQALVVLYSVALASALMAAAIEEINYWLSLVLVPILIVALTLLAAYLGRLKVVSGTAPSQRGQNFSHLMLELTVRQRLLEVILDFFLIGIAYYLAFLASFNLQMNKFRFSLFLDSLPFALACTYLTLYVVGIYRSFWRYIGLDDLIRNIQAATGSLLLFAAVIFGLGSLDLVAWTGAFPEIILLYYAIFLFLGLSVTRSSFRFLDILFRRQTRPDEQRIIIMGAGDAGEIALRWILMNPHLKYRPIGFVDEDPLITGRHIHGIKVIGRPNEIIHLISKYQVNGLIVTDWKNELDQSTLVEICQDLGCWVRRFRLEIEDY